MKRSIGGVTSTAEQAITAGSDHGALGELGLDPVDDTEWDAVSALAQQMVTDMLRFLHDIREEPAWRPVPPDVREHFRAELPLEGQGAEAAYADFRRLVLPYRVGNVHPRFWGRVQGSGSVVGMLAELLAAGMNENGSGLAAAGPYVEAQVLAWCKTMLGYPERASGVFVSGGSVANLVALAVTRHAAARRIGIDVARDGVAAFPSVPVVYGSTECHISITRALAVLGLGTASFRRIEVDAAYRIRADVLRRAIVDDLAAGRLPIAIVGNAGSVNTGATDDLAALADAAAEHGLWLHVDGAFGAWAAVSPALRPRLRGLDRADSVAFDFHKWLYAPYDAGAVLVRDGEVHRSTFATVRAHYIGRAERGAEADPFRFNELGLQLSRSFRALKVWLTLKAYGVDRFRRLIEQNVAQAAYLASRVEAHPDLELLAPVPLNVVCFRFRPSMPPSASSASLSPGGAPQLDAVNQEILMRLHEEGIAVPTSVRLGGAFGFRCAITNHRSRRADFDLLVVAVARIGHEIVEAERRPAR